METLATTLLPMTSAQTPTSPATSAAAVALSAGAQATLSRFQTCVQNLAGGRQGEGRGGPVTEWVVEEVCSRMDGGVIQGFYVGWSEDERFGCLYRHMDRVVRRVRRR